ncbi:Uncharacterized protein DAT39_021381, partial [Clarias magur]
IFLHSPPEEAEESGSHSCQRVAERSACLEERLPGQQERGGVYPWRPLCDWSRES